MSKKLIYALGLESDAPVVAPAGEIDFGESDNLISEGGGLTEAGSDAIQTVATLESLNTIIDNSPEDQINETTAAIVDAVIQDINGRYEMAKETRLAVESYKARGAKAYRQIAKEDISSKLAGFKKGIETIIEKIIELIQKFWQWLTMNHKRVKASLVEAASAVKGADGEQAIAFQTNFRALLTGEKLTTEGIDETANAIHDLCEASQNFITTSFGVAGKHAYAHNRIVDEVKKSFSDYVTSNANEYLFYSNIGGRKFMLALNPELKDSAPEISQQVFETSLVAVEERNESPEEITLVKAEVVKMLQAATAVVDISEKEFDKINRIQAALRRNKQIGTGDDGITMPVNVVAAYNKCIVHFIDGVFTQALRHGNAVAALAKAYAKQGKNTTEA